MTLKEIQEMVEKEVDITPETAADSSLYFCRIRRKYFDMWMSELNLLKALQILKDKTYAEKLHELKTKGYKGFEVGKSKNDIDAYMILDKDYRNLQRDFINQEMKVKYLEGTCEMIDKMSFNIQNYINLQKLKLGII